MVVLFHCKSLRFSLFSHKRGRNSVPGLPWAQFLCYTRDQEPHVFRVATVIVDHNGASSLVFVSTPEAIDLATLSASSHVTAFGSVASMVGDEVSVLVWPRLWPLEAQLS